MNSPLNLLQKYWKHSNFRPLQEDIIEAVLNNQNTIALLPTGGGKSVCFQLPALLLKGVCIVISPLIALMQNQVEELQKKGIKALTLPQGSSQEELITLFDNLKFGNYTFLYLSPERLQSKFIQNKIKELTISLIAVDEAHCISEWGHDFRPSYRNINILKELQPKANFIALTASATPKVLKDIATNLELKNPRVFKKSFFRKNLAYQIFTVEDKLNRLLQIFNKTKLPAIVYVNSRKKTVQIAAFLAKNGFKTSYYHGGLPLIEKEISFKNWMNEKTPIMVATNAFGMGIDKANVGVVVHYDFSSSIENYLQEAGRAGRNGKKAYAVTLQNANDIRLFEEQNSIATPTLSEIKKIHRKLYQHFQIATGELLEDSFDFNFFEFCKKYNFIPSKTATSLTILAQNEIIEITTDFNKKSTLKLNVSSKNILKHNAQKKLIDLILRSYSGVFEQETKINEFTLAKKANTTSLQIIKNLQRLQNEGLLTYKQATSKTSILFLKAREDDTTINSVSKNITSHLLNKKQKTEDIVRFIKNNNICRSNQLLRYFGEKTATNCEICDVCLTNKKRDTKSLSEEIITLISSKEVLSSQEICAILNANQQDILIHLRQLLSEEKIGLNNQNKFYLK